MHTPHSADGKQKNRAHWDAMANCGTHWHGTSLDDLLVALDDTDNLDSPGTGFRARELARVVSAAGLGQPQGITRHQLLVDPRIPYTSHNSSACLVVRGVTNADAVTRLAHDYLLEASAPGSDTGLCVARRADVPAEVRRWGARAKTEVLQLADAPPLAAAHGLFLEGLTGTHGGMIGALAAVGLHAAGDDGRFLWIKGLREAAGRTLAAADLATTLHVLPRAFDGDAVPSPHASVALGDWPRAVLRDHQPILFLEKDDESTGDVWRVVDKQRLKVF